MLLLKEVIRHEIRGLWPQIRVIGEMAIVIVALFAGGCYVTIAQVSEWPVIAGGCFTFGALLACATVPCIRNVHPAWQNTTATTTFEPPIPLDHAA